MRLYCYNSTAHNKTDTEEPQHLRAFKSDNAGPERKRVCLVREDCIAGPLSQFVLGIERPCDASVAAALDAGLSENAADALALACAIEIGRRALVELGRSGATWSALDMAVAASEVRHG